ncbi:hypothetical protein AB0E06_38380, partial [Streptomyces sp. NPDC048109]|uniref:hypothetical protein n=1 Tax=Streptomyces sp. NPDC048109 TaxID=3155482 RepID=UPI003433E3B5
PSRTDNAPALIGTQCGERRSACGKQQLRDSPWPVRDLPTQDVEELGNPADIAAEIVADLRKAIAAFEEVAATFAKPEPITAPGAVEAT